MATVTIKRIQATNLKRLTRVDIKTDSAVVRVGGKNGQGKSSLLDCIEMGLRGGAAIGQDPVRHGADRAEILLDLGDCILKRTIKPNGNTVCVLEGKDGARFPRPQTLVDQRIAPYTCDPQAFLRAKPDAQADVLRELVHQQCGVDFAQLEADYDSLYRDRTIVTRDFKEQQSVVNNLPEYKDVPADEVSVADLSAKLEEALAVNAKNAEVRRIPGEIQQTSIGAINGQLDAAEKTIADLKGKLAKWEAHREGLGSRREALCKQRDQAEANAAVVKDVDTQVLREHISTAEQTNQKVRANLSRANAQARAESYGKQSQELTGKLDAIEKTKADALTKAKLPVKGLAFNGEGLLYNSVPLSGCSSSEQWTVAVALALALKPGPVLIREANLLDDSTQRLVEDICGQAGAQLFMEFVTDEPATVEVFIENGEVKTNGGAQ